MGDADGALLARMLQLNDALLAAADRLHDRRLRLHRVEQRLRHHLPQPRATSPPELERDECAEDGADTREHVEKRAVRETHA